MLIYLTQQSVEKCCKTRLRFLRKNQHFSMNLKILLILKKLLKSWFHEIFFAWSYFAVLFHTVPCIDRFFFDDFSKLFFHHFFREINEFSAFVLLQWFDEIFILNFSEFLSLDWTTLTSYSLHVFHLINESFSCRSSYQFWS